jgi:hypothetical protein
MRGRLFEQAAPYKILLQSAVQFTVIYALYTCWFWSSGLYCCVDLYVHTNITSSTFSPEGWDSMFLWNVGAYLQVHRVLHHRRPTLISFNFLRTSSLIHCIHLLQSVDSPREAYLKKLLFQVVNEVSDVDVATEHLRCLLCPYSYFLSDNAVCRRPATLFHVTCEDSLWCRYALDQMFDFFSCLFIWLAEC